MTVLLLFKSSAAIDPVTGTAITSQAQTIAASGAFTAVGVSGAGATSQAQTIAGSGTATPPPNVTGTAATSQAQTIAADGSAAHQDVTGEASTSQAQTIDATGEASPAEVSGTASSSQAQTTVADGTHSTGVSGTGSTSQAQSTLGDGAVVNGEEAAPSFNGGFVMSTGRKVYVKRGKKYLIFNNNEEADTYLAAETAIETAKKSSRGAARRVIKALKIVKPEIAPAPVLEDISALLARFNINYDIKSLENNHDIDSIYQIQYMLYALQDEEDIELLLLA